MATLVIAEHDNHGVRAGTLNAVTAGDPLVPQSVDHLIELLVCFFVVCELVTRRFGQSAAGHVTCLTNPLRLAFE